MGDTKVDKVTRMLGRKLGGRYELLSVLGQGAMGTVYLAAFGRLSRRVAVKVIPPHLLEDDEARIRFSNEAWAAAQLDHPNVVKALDAGVEDDGTPWLVMEYLKGRNLREVLRARGGPLPWQETVPIVEDALRGLEAAHARELIHRDLKPENLFLLDEGRPGSCKVVDFGIVKALTSAPADGVTRAGSFLGTPSYAAPELIRGAPEVATDLYALGATWFELIVGVPPFGRGDPLEILWKHLDKRPPRPMALRPELGLPFGVEELIMQLLEKDPDLRPSSAREVLETLADRAQGATSQSRFASSFDLVPDLDLESAALAAATVFPPLFGPTGTALVRPRWEEVERSPSDSGEIPVQS